MSAPAAGRTVESRGEMLLGLMVTAIAVLVALIALMSHLSEWWLLPITVGALLGMTVLVLLAFSACWARTATTTAWRSHTSFRRRPRRGFTDGATWSGRERGEPPPDSGGAGHLRGARRTPATGRSGVVRTDWRLHSAA